MPIKATGTVTENAGNGRHLKINWTPVKPRREWFLYIYRGTIWRVDPGGWRNNGLITFVLEGEDQEVDPFRNAITGRTDSATSPKPIPAMLGRTSYSKFSDRLLTYRSDRRP